VPRLPVDVLDVEAFLRLPDFKPSFEFFDGRVVQKFAKNLPRSVIQLELTTALNAFAQSKHLGRAFVSLRIILGGSVLVPEISFFGAGRVPRYVRGEQASEVTIAPDLAIEFLAPRQSPTEARHKLNLLIEHGGKLGWLIDTKREQIEIIRPNQVLEVLGVSDVISGEALLPGFTLGLEEIFGWLDQK
jgi:Uma2 family endonuclease